MQADSQTQAPSFWRSRRGYVTALGLITLLGMALRVYKLGEYPTGYSQDEVVCVYDAWSLLTTGAEHHGERWPLNSRQFGDYPAAIPTYLTMPFVALLGPTAIATRWPCALLNAAAVFFLGLLAGRLFRCRAVGVCAAALLAVSPWNLYFSRCSFSPGFVTFFQVAARNSAKVMLAFLEGWANRASLPPEPTIKAGFIYVGPIGDYGWSHAHNEGRLYVEKKFPWLKTIYVESVPEPDVERVIDRLIVEERCDVVFTTSFGFMDGTLAAALKYPDKLFFHCSGYKRAPNLGTYFIDFAQLYYLNGLMAGALSKTGKAGYVGAFPIAEVVRHINSFVLGFREINPKGTVDVNWLMSWYDPVKAKQAAEALIAGGVDALAFTEDSPSVLQVAEEYTLGGQPVYAFSHYSPMEKFGPNATVSGQLVDWGILYEDILAKIRDRIYLPTNLESVDYWWLMAEDAAKLGGSFDHSINPKFIQALQMVKHDDVATKTANVLDLVNARVAQMSSSPPTFDPFTGPILDQNGKEQIPAGRVATFEELLTMQYLVQGCTGQLP